MRYWLKSPTRSRTPSESRSERGCIGGGPGARVWCYHAPLAFPLPGSRGNLPHIQVTSSCVSRCIYLLASLDVVANAWLYLSNTSEGRTLQPQAKPSGRRGNAGKRAPQLSLEETVSESGRLLPSPFEVRSVALSVAPSGQRRGQRASGASKVAGTLESTTAPEERPGRRHCCCEAAGPHEGMDIQRCDPLCVQRHWKARRQTWARLQDVLRWRRQLPALRSWRKQMPWNGL